MLALHFAASIALAKGAPTLLLDPRVHAVAYAAELRLDPTQDTFQGVIDVDLELERGTRHLWLNATDLVIGEATLESLSKGGGGNTQPVAVASANQHVVSLSWDQAVRGPVRIHFVYEGKVSSADTQGVFRLEEEGDWYLFSQFESTDARRAFPCIDQPDARAPWTITLTVPEGQVAVSNMPEQSSTTEAGWKTIHFEPTPPLPTYLVAFAVGPFEIIDLGSVGRRPTPIRILTGRGKTGWAGWATESTPEILRRLEDWFGEAHPFPKLDVVALPQGVGFAAMEHVGLVTCDQGVLLARPGEDTLPRQRFFASVMIHELAHQWFGNLVTHEWWDDIWLNESFASWMETVTLVPWKPEWRYDVAAVMSKGGVMGQDALTTSRRIREPIEAYDDIENAFDGITYGKGEAVIAMFEAWLGEERFHSVIRKYFEQYAMKNANGDDFLAVLESEAGDDAADAFRTFIDQPGVPLIQATVDCSAAPAIVLSQEPYVRLGSRVRDRQARWDVPVCVRWGDEGGPKRACFLLDEREARFVLPGAKGCPAWLQPNDKASGYYRVALDADALLPLLKADGPLSLVERIGAVSDADAQVEAGRLDPIVLLDQVPDLARENEPRLLGATTGIIAGLHRDLVPRELEPNYRRLVNEVYGPSARELGFDPVADEDEEITLLRPRILMMVGDLGEDPALIAEAQRRALQWLADRTGTAPELVHVVLGLAVRHGDVALFERMKTEVLAETDRKRRNELLDAMGSFRDPVAVERAMAMALDERIDMREGYGLLRTPLGDRATRDAAWSFIQANVDAIAGRLPIVGRARIVGTTRAFCDQEHRDQAETFFEERSKGWVGAARDLAQALESVDQCIASKEAQASSVRAFLERW